jgi:hypothetical protein
MTKFAITCSWLRHKGESEIDQTLSKLIMTVGDRVVTEYRSEYLPQSEHLEIPAYYLAEWIAGNWWPLLWEPRKNEDIGDDQDFLDRHCILAAQHGFALPKVLIVPQGKNINVSAGSRSVPLADDVRFLRSGNVVLPRQDIETELWKLVQKVVSRLSSQHISGTTLQELWELIGATTDPEELVFCRFMGALGASPYVPNPIMEEILESALKAYGERLVLDLCWASTPEDFDPARRSAEAAYSAITSTPDSDLSPLSNVQPPPDSVSLPAWRRGSNAAKRLREKLQISDMDPRGSDRLFERLRVDPGRKATTGANAGVNAPIPIVVGVVQRNDQAVRIALVQENERHRRFAAARGIFAAWASEQPQESRFLTPSVTRDQQANRSFAAEILAPFSYIRSQAMRGRISQDRIFELASDLNIGSDVVWKHAQNKGLQVVRG